MLHWLAQRSSSYLNKAPSKTDCSTHPISFLLLCRLFPQLFLPPSLDSSHDSRLSGRNNSQDIVFCRLHYLLMWTHSQELQWEPLLVCAYAEVIFWLVALETLLLALLFMMILDDIPSFELIFLLSIFAEYYRVTSLSADPMELSDLEKLFAFHFILFFGSFNYYFDSLMSLICYEICYFIIIQILVYINIFITIKFIAGRQVWWV